MRAKTSFSCQSCGHQSPRWIGRCPDCGGWNTMKEERQAPTGKGRPVAMKMAQAKATPEQLEAVTDALLLAMHDLRGFYGRLASHLERDASLRVAERLGARLERTQMLRGSEAVYVPMKVPS